MKTMGCTDIFLLGRKSALIYHRPHPGKFTHLFDFGAFKFKHPADLLSSYFLRFIL